MRKFQTIVALAVVGMCASLLCVGCDDDAGVSCPDVHMVSFSAASQGVTKTCGPETLPADVDISKSGTLVTAKYHSQLMTCGGKVDVTIHDSGGKIEVKEKVLNGGICGCHMKYVMTIKAEFCGPGTYTLVINGKDHTVTI